MTIPMKQYEVLEWASSFLKKHDRDTHIAEVLLEHHLQIDRTTFFMQMRELIQPSVMHAFREDIERHVETGIPVQHMIGKAPFYGRDFKVTPAVLIPRFDTEILVEQVLDYLRANPDRSDLVVVDVGTGSGIIAITLKLEVPSLTVYATDISEQALQVAEENADYYGADIHFLKGNFLEPLLQKQLFTNLIVSNPPYINYQDVERLADTVKVYDPDLALYAEEEGLAAYRDIIAQSTELNAEQLQGIFFEIGYEQATAVTKISREKYPESMITTHTDLNAKDRVVKAIV